jgi:crotonobetainyl-CoA:carnitine CoA-transferase CaiB-like acyl-CoA transferase
MLLGDFGADVIKIEAPEGERGRLWGIARFGARSDISSLFAAFNRNKRSLSVDLTSERGRELAYRLTAGADVVLENYFPGVAAKLGIDYEQLCRVKSDLIYCRLSGFGATGPLRDRPGYDSHLQAYAGPQSITGEAGRPSVRIGPSTIDTLSGFQAALGILIALRHRDRTGEGQFVDTSLYDAALQLMSPWIVDYTATGKVPEKFGPYFPMLVPSGNFVARDGEVYIAVSPGPMWKRFCELIDRTELADDERFRSNELRCLNRLALYDDILVPYFLTQRAVDFVDRAVANGIAASLINDIAAVVRQEQAAARQMITPVLGLGDIRSSGIPIKLSRSPGEVRVGPPSLGRDSLAILRDAGYSEDAMRTLIRDRVVIA